MKKFLQVSGWILVVFVCFYLMGLGQRTPRGTVDERMDYLEQRLEELESSVDDWAAELNYRTDEIPETLDDISGSIEDLYDWLFSEIDNREMYGEWTEWQIQDLRDSIEELKEEIDRLKTG